MSHFLRQSRRTRHIGSAFLRREPPAVPPHILWYREGGVSRMFRGGGCWMLGVCAVALGAGILIAAIFPVGALLFLVAFLLIGCGCACCRR